MLTGPRHCRCAAPIRSIQDLLMQMTRLHTQIENGVLYTVMIGQVKMKKDESPPPQNKLPNRGISCAMIG